MGLSVGARCVRPVRRRNTGHGTEVTPTRRTSRGRGQRTSDGLTYVEESSGLGYPSRQEFVVEVDDLGLVPSLSRRIKFGGSRGVERS